MKTVLTLFLAIFLFLPVESSVSLEAPYNAFGTCRWKKRDKCQYNYDRMIFIKNNRYWEPANLELL